MCLTSMDIFLPRLLAELHSDSWYLRFCFKTILKLMRRMLVALLDTMKESPATVAAVDRFMRDEVRCSCIYNLQCRFYTHLHLYLPIIYTRPCPCWTPCAGRGRAGGTPWCTGTAAPPTS